jgi:serine-type D-Ala-D-Ala carboxypeptidase/endopeptidase (penicillin-binding protein 4)
MNRILLFIALLPLALTAQTVSQKLQTAFLQFEKDPQLASAISSLYIIDAKTGKVVFDKHSRVGLAPASTQKIITSVTAFELLKNDFRYQTILQTVGDISDSVLNGQLYMIGSGDPTLGSNRYPLTKSEVLLNAWANAVRKQGIKKITGQLSFNYRTFPYQAVPDGWIWEDIGNYYGAGAFVINWKENQFDITLNSTNDPGKLPYTDQETSVVSPAQPVFVNELKAGPKGSGDNAFCYLPLQGNAWMLKGSIPKGETKFTISAANNDPAKTLFTDLITALQQKSIATNGTQDYISELTKPAIIAIDGRQNTILYTHYSPSLDSIIYWFNKKSINLYGEALVKTMGGHKKASASTDSGIAVIKEFWKAKGISEHELNLFDGSGLSPLNRVTTRAQVEILKYAKTKDWFQSFYNSLPLYNGMVMKSGTINNTKGFCGYHVAKDGNGYIFSFLVNNYNGRSADLVGKMYKVLDVLK